MKKNPLFVAVSNQKVRVGISTMLVTLASLLNYSMDKNVAIVDCGSTQRCLLKPFLDYQEKALIVSLKIKK